MGLVPYSLYLFRIRPTNSSSSVRSPGQSPSLPDGYLRLGYQGRSPPLSAPSDGLPERPLQIQPCWRRFQTRVNPPRTPRRLPQHRLEPPLKCVPAADAPSSSRRGLPPQTIGHAPMRRSGRKRQLTLHALRDAGALGVDPLPGPGPGTGLVQLRFSNPPRRSPPRRS